MSKSIKTVISNYAFILSLELCKFVKLSLALANGGVLFTLTQIFSPLIGLYKNSSLNFLLYGMRTILRMGIFGFSPLLFLYHLPTLVGNIYLSSDSVVPKIAIPFVCMLLFVLNPIGNQAFLYSMYWLIPIAIALYKPESIFLRALGSTFTVHSVGSVVWLYTKHIDPSVWHMLIPVVIIERVLMAAATTGLFHLTQLISNKKSNQTMISSDINRSLTLHHSQ